MPDMRYVLLYDQNLIQFVKMPSSHAYQLTALMQRLNKEAGKLTADNVPKLPVVVAECDNPEPVHPDCRIVEGLDYINELEKGFAGIRESSYPLISLLTEIRALQAQMEQWAEEENE